MDRVRDTARRAVSAPALCLRVGGLTALMLVSSAVAASGAQVSGQAIVPVPVPAPTGTAAPADPGPLKMVALPRPATEFHIVPTAAIAPLPPSIVMAPGALGIPKIALAAYRNAEQMMAKAQPGCGVSWNLLAGIGRIESGHANGGATDAGGRAIRPIYGPSLDGSLPGNEVIVDSQQSRGRGAPVYVRAEGPMQFLPSTWARYASDAKGDGTADPQNIYDASLAAARYLCSGGLNLRDRAQVMSSVLRYNNSLAYAQNVLGWAAAYATGVYPTNLPTLTAADTAPELKAHLAGGRGLGPGSALDVAALSPNDPLAQLPIVNPTLPDRGGIVGPPGLPTPVESAPVPDAGCFVFCAPADPFAPPMPPPAAPPNPFAPAPPVTAPPNPFAPAPPVNPFAPPQPTEPMGPPPGPTP